MAIEKSVTALAGQLLSGEPGKLMELRIHEFPDDTAAHDDEGIERLQAEFVRDLDAASIDLTKAYGEPIRSGDADDEDIPLNGVFRFKIWEVAGTRLFIAAAFEDRGVPILLMLGTF